MSKDKKLKQWDKMIAKAQKNFNKSIKKEDKDLWERELQQLESEIFMIERGEL